MEQAVATKADIFVVDDTPENLRLLSTALLQRGYKVRSAIDGSMALMGATAAPPDLMLLDVNMPGLNGYEVCRRLKASAITRDVPVIFISALDEVMDKVQAFALGGVDYITKPFHFEEVVARIENQLTIRRLSLSLQALNAELEQRVRDRTAALEQEVQERQRAQEQLLHLALHDPLTNLPNRTSFLKTVQVALARARQQLEQQFAILFLDCDRFKTINDSLGHSVGDELLIAIAARLQTCLRPEDTLARLGGDEFIICRAAIIDLNQATAFAQHLNEQLRLPFYPRGYEVFVNASIGIVLSDANYDDAEHLLRNADTAMYHAKALGRGRAQVFDPSMYARALNRLKLENDLRRAIERQEFYLCYQPVVSLRSGEIIGFEALVRWQHPDRGVVKPAEFIPAAEETGAITSIGDWVLAEACQQLKQWQERGLAPAGLSVSVNLSVRQFAQRDSLTTIDAVLQATQLSAKCLKLEITESVLIDSPESAMATFEELRARHIQLSLDDFGTGYSSLSYLHRFAMDALKIDRSFTSKIDSGHKNLEIVQAIVSLSHTLGMEAIAEGIETASQLAQLRTLGCDCGQGHFFAPPLLPAAAADLLRQRPRW
ncbi:MAG: EAL domain-containing protein [Spirulinaceae cyanobacterium SM2_1_0]|nr:EAL domain-containing protein [Spirulinaceae cyanobacterium SM2_1_0]